MITNNELDIIWNALNEYKDNHGVEIKEIFYKLCNKVPREEQYIERIKYFSELACQRAEILRNIEESLKPWQQ